MTNAQNSPIYAPGGRFDILINKIVSIEGGYNNIAADRGGATKYGISLRFLKAEGLIDANHDGFADFDLDFDHDIDAADVRILTPQMAKKLYYYCFYDKYSCGKLPQPIDGAVLDQAINGGGVSAIKLLQTSINDLMPNSLVVDGVIGGKTIGAAIAASAKYGRKLLDRYRVNAAKRYRAIVAANPSQKIFLNGWLRRASELGDV